MWLQTKISRGTGNPEGLVLGTLYETYFSKKDDQYIVINNSDFWNQAGQWLCLISDLQYSSKWNDTQISQDEHCSVKSLAWSERSIESHPHEIQMRGLISSDNPSSPCIWHSSLPVYPALLLPPVALIYWKPHPSPSPSPSYSSTFAAVNEMCIAHWGVSTNLLLFSRTGVTNWMWSNC